MLGLSPGRCGVCVKDRLMEQSKMFLPLVHRDTEVRRRVTREQLGQCGTTKEKVWVNRHLLLTSQLHSNTRHACVAAPRAGSSPRCCADDRAADKSCFPGAGLVPGIARHLDH